MKSVRGHHVFGSIWSPTIVKWLVCRCEVSNALDTSAVAVLCGATVVDHVAWRISSARTLFLANNGSTDSHCTQCH